MGARYKQVVTYTLRAALPWKQKLRQSGRYILPHKNNSGMDSSLLDNAIRQVKPRYFPALTGVRGYAAIWVFLFHAFQDHRLPGISNGYLGVDLFFVLSGFIISHVHSEDFSGAEKWHAFKRFMALRFSRIYPIHIGVLLTFAAIAFAYPQLPHAFTPSAFSRFNFICNVFLIQTWVIPFVPFDMRGPGWSWNGPAWSLSAEWLLYLLFPMIILILRKFQRPHLLVCIGILLLTITGGLQFYQIGLAGLPRATAEFTAGCALYLAIKGVEGHSKIWDWLAIIGLLTLLCAALIPGWNVIAPGACFVLISGIAYGSGLIARSLSAPLSIFFGEISLSLYLIHWPLLQIRKHVFLFTDKPGEVFAPSYVLFLGGIIATAYLVHRYFELPMIKWCRNALLRARFR